MTPEGDRLGSRIRQVRRVLAAKAVAPISPAPERERDNDSATEMRTHIADLEHMIQGLQDAVYRESQRQDRRISQLEAQLQPGALAAALSKDARDRGL